MARRYPPRIEAALEARFAVRRNASDAPLATEALLAGARGASHLFVSVTERVSAELIEPLSPHLRVIATLSVGHDHIDVAAATRAGVAVLNTPDVLTNACADLALLLILGTGRRMLEAVHLAGSGGWTGWAPTQLLGLGLSGRRLGILGMGRIGQAVAARARAFGMEIHYHNRTHHAEQGAAYHDHLTSLLTVADVLCLCASGGSALAGCIDAAALARLPTGAVIVNIARGDMIDDDALLAALDSGRVAGAGLDVHAREPWIDPRYRGRPNVILTPHIGSATEQAREAMGLLLMHGCDLLDAGQRPPNQVN